MPLTDNIFVTIALSLTLLGFAVFIIVTMKDERDKAPAAYSMLLTLGAGFFLTSYYFRNAARQLPSDYALQNLRSSGSTLN